MKNWNIRKHGKAMRVNFPLTNLAMLSLFARSHWLFQVIIGCSWVTEQWVSIWHYCWSRVIEIVMKIVNFALLSRCRDALACSLSLKQLPGERRNFPNSVAPSNPPFPWIEHAFARRSPREIRGERGRNVALACQTANRRANTGLMNIFDFTHIWLSTIKATNYPPINDRTFNNYGCISVIYSRFCLMRSGTVRKINIFLGALSRFAWKLSWTARL